MPSFLGQPLGSVNLALLDAGFHVGNVSAMLSVPDTTQGVINLSAQSLTPPQPSPASIIVSQNPAPGQKVNAGATVNFEVR
jgi:hypothetical protein